MENGRRRVGEGIEMEKLGGKEAELCGGVTF
jgi:hypothetical protein